MRGLSKGFLADTGFWWAAIVNNAANRWLSATEQIQNPAENYTSKELIADVFYTWKDVWSFPMLNNVGGFPFNAYIKVEEWSGSRPSNPVPKPMNPTFVGDQLLPISLGEQPDTEIKITSLTRIGSSDEVIPDDHVTLVNAGDATKASFHVLLDRLGELPGTPPGDGHYTGIVYCTNRIIAHVHVLVDTRSRKL